MFRCLPPAGHPIPITRVLQALLFLGNFREDYLLQALKGYLSVRHGFLTSSGSASLVLILKSLASIAKEKTEVIIPAYCCPLVASAVIKAGLKVKLCDIEKKSFGFDFDVLKELVSDNTLAVVAVHLFGLPVDFPEIRKITGRYGVTIIEDAAHSFGSIDDYQGQTRMQGALGDVGFFSFGRGKPLSLLHGGCIVTESDKLALLIQNEIDGVNDSTGTFRHIAELLFYSIFFYPHLYWIPQSMPFLGIGKTVYSEDYAITKMGFLAEVLGALLIDKELQNFRDTRIKNATLIGKSFAGIKGVASPFSHFTESEMAKLPPLRYPLVFENPNVRKYVLEVAKKEGLGASEQYPAPLNEQVGVPESITGGYYPNAKWVSERLLTFPLHRFVTNADVERIRHIIDNAQSEVAPNCWTGC